MVYSKWQIDRGQLNHNWLQNGVLVGLNHALSIVNGSVRTSKVRKSLTNNVLRWQERKMELRELLVRFENEMSPRVLFETLPLCRCSEETKKWLVPIIHELWLKRENIMTKISVARESYQKVEVAFAQVSQSLNKLPETPAGEDYVSFVITLRLFTAACETLSQSISALPQEIRCV